MILSLPPLFNSYFFFHIVQSKIIYAYQKALFYISAKHNKQPQCSHGQASVMGTSIIHNKNNIDKTKTTINSFTFIQIKCILYSKQKIVFINFDHIYFMQWFYICPSSINKINVSSIPFRCSNEIGKCCKPDKGKTKAWGQFRFDWYINW